MRGERETRRPRAGPRRTRGLWRRGRAGCGCLIVLAAFVALVLVTIAVPVAVFAVGPQVGGLLERVFVEPVVAVEATIIQLPLGWRLLMFGLWLALTVAVAVGLFRAVGSRIAYDSVPSVLVASTASVIIAFSLTSWVMYLVLDYLRLRPDV